jgi:hypothetical protein
VDSDALVAQGASRSCASRFRFLARAAMFEPREQQCFARSGKEVSLYVARYFFARSEFESKKSLAT